MKRKTILLSLLVFVLTAIAQEAVAGSFNTGTDTTAPAAIRIRCAPSLLPGDKPLFVVDGIPVDSMDISTIRPEQIECIYIMKGTEAKAIYGCRAMPGAVIIHFKPRMLYLQAINSYTGELIPAADLQVKMDKQKNNKSVGAGGVVEVSYYKNTELEISASGYTTSRHLVGRGGGDTLLVLLEPVAQLLPEVIVKGVQDTRICGRTISCGGTHVSICYMHVTDNTGKKNVAGAGMMQTARLYPNPASAGSQLKIQLPVAVSGSVSLALYGLNGQLIKQVVDKSNTGQLIFSLPSAFKGAGILLAQDETKNIIIKEKIVTQ
jgi:hypothetical protein